MYRSLVLNHREIKRKWKKWKFWSKKPWAPRAPAPAPCVFNFKLSKVLLSVFLLFIFSCSLLVFLLTYLLLGFVLGLSFDYFLIWVLASFLACLLFRCDGEGQNIGFKSTSIGQFSNFKNFSPTTPHIWRFGCLGVNKRCPTWCTQQLGLFKSWIRSF